MIWQPARLEWRSNIFWGWESPAMHKQHIQSQLQNKGLCVYIGPYYKSILFWSCKLCSVAGHTNTKGKKIATPPSCMWKTIQSNPTPPGCLKKNQSQNQLLFYIPKFSCFSRNSLFITFIEVFISEAWTKIQPTPFVQKYTLPQIFLASPMTVLNGSFRRMTFLVVRHFDCLKCELISMSGSSCSCGHHRRYLYGCQLLSNQCNDLITFYPVKSLSYQVTSNKVPHTLICQSTMHNRINWLYDVRK